MLNKTIHVSQKSTLPNKNEQAAGDRESPNKISRNKGKKLLLKWQWKT